MHIDQCQHLPGWKGAKILVKKCTKEDAKDFGGSTYFIEKKKLSTQETELGIALASGEACYERARSAKRVSTDIH